MIGERIDVLAECAWLLVWDAPDVALGGVTGRSFNASQGADHERVRLSVRKRGSADSEPPLLNGTSPRFADKRLLTPLASERQYTVRPKDPVAKTTRHDVFPNAF